MSYSIIHRNFYFGCLDHIHPKPSNPSIQNIRIHYRRSDDVAVAFLHHRLVFGQWGFYDMQSCDFFDFERELDVLSIAKSKAS